MCRFAFILSVLALSAVSGRAADISGTITNTLTIRENSQLSGDVTCNVTGAPCISIAASGITLDLNGFSITGLGDPETGCGGTGFAGEFGLSLEAQSNVTIRGPGLVQRFRNQGIRLLNSAGVTIT